MDLESELDRLYQVSPGGFVDARNALAKGLRQAGNKEAAAAIAKRARPTPVAWVVNALHFRARRELDALCEEGAALREAQEARFDPTEFAERRRTHHEALRAVVDRGMLLGEENGLNPNAAFRRRLESTLNLLGGSAGVVDPPPGRMSVELETMGFDALTAAAPAPVPSRPKREAPVASAEHVERIESVGSIVQAMEKAVRRLEQELQSSEAKHTRAARDAEDAAERARLSAEARDTARTEAEQMQQRLNAARLELSEARRAFDEIRGKGSAGATT